MIKEIEFIDTAGPCLIDESNVSNVEHPSVFQIQYILGGAWKSPPTKSFLTKVGLSSVGSNWYSCNSSTAFATANDIREGKNEYAFWLPGEHWKLGLEKSLFSSDVLSLEWPLKLGSKYICFSIKREHSWKSSTQSWSEMDMREEYYFILHPFSALFYLSSWCKGRSSRNIEGDLTVLAPNQIQRIRNF